MRDLSAGSVEYMDAAIAKDNPPVHRVAKAHVHPFKTTGIETTTVSLGLIAQPKKPKIEPSRLAFADTWCGVRMN